MVELLTPAGTQAKVEIVYQTLDGLREACPDHTGDWYFSGDYPTPGGVKLVNQAFINYMEEIYQFKQMSDGTATSGKTHTPVAGWGRTKRHPHADTVNRQKNN